MKKILFITFLILITSLPVLAYTLEVEIPGSKLEGPVDLVKYINGIYKSAYLIIGFVALGSLVLAGIMYMSSVAVGEIQAAKDRIWSTIGGVFLALTIALIFKTVNPTLLNTNLPNITPVAKCGEIRDIGNGNESIKGFCTGLREVCIDKNNSTPDSLVLPSYKCVTAPTTGQPKYACVKYSPVFVSNGGLSDTPSLLCDTGNGFIVGTFKWNDTYKQYWDGYNFFE